MALIYGLECEYFLRSKKDGHILGYVPPAWPMDAAGNLIEARSIPSPDINVAVSDLIKKRDELEQRAKAENLELVNIPQHTYGDNGLTSTAGLHIHFSESSGKQMDMPAMMENLNVTFRRIIQESGRTDPYYLYRMKPHGWEYRALPATMCLLTLASHLKTWRFR